MLFTTMSRSVRMPCRRSSSPQIGSDPTPRSPHLLGGRGDCVVLPDACRAHVRDLPRCGHQASFRRIVTGGAVCDGPRLAGEGRRVSRRSSPRTPGRRWPPARRSSSPWSRPCGLRPASPGARRIVVWDCSTSSGVAFRGETRPTSGSRGRRGRRRRGWPDPAGRGRTPASGRQLRHVVLQCLQAVPDPVLGRLRLLFQVAAQGGQPGPQLPDREVTHARHGVQGSGR
jgi:hypothetical protein